LQALLALVGELDRVGRVIVDILEAAAVGHALRLRQGAGIGLGRRVLRKRCACETSAQDQRSAGKTFRGLGHGRSFCWNSVRLAAWPLPADSIRQGNFARPISNLLPGRDNGGDGRGAAANPACPRAGLIQ
jgi:hypothetical protein